MPGYTLLSSWGRPNIQGRGWLAQTEDDKIGLLANEKLEFGDEIYVVESKKN